MMNANYEKIDEIIKIEQVKYNYVDEK